MIDQLKEKLRLAILKIISLKEFKFFGTLLYNINLRLINDLNHTSENEEDNNRDIKVVFNKQLNKFEFQIYLSFIKKYKEENIIYILLHNILHILNRHNSRQRSKDDKVVYNIAADHVINKELTQAALSEHSVPPNYIQLLSRLERKNLTTEQVYDILMSNKIKDNSQSTTQTFSIDCGGPDKTPSDSNKNESEDKIEEDVENQSSGDQQNKNEDIIEENFDIKINHEEFDDFGKIDIIDNLEEVNPQSNIEANNQLNELQRTAAMLLEQDSISRGIKSSNLLSYLKEITKLELPWDNLLEKAILTKIIPNPDDRLWNNPRKRLRAHNIILPGPGIDKKLECLTICIDLSGSISRQNLKKFAGICLNAVGKFDKVWILKHDTRILEDKLLNKNEIDDHDFFYKMKAGGGTSHRKVFEKIEEKYLEHQLNFGLVILLTDFISDITYIFDKYKWTKNIPIINLITGKSLPRNINEYGGGILINTL